MDKLLDLLHEELNYLEDREEYFGQKKIELLNKIKKLERDKFIKEKSWEKLMNKNLKKTFKKLIKNIEYETENSEKRPMYTEDLVIEFINDEKIIVNYEDEYNDACQTSLYLNGECNKNKIFDQLSIVLLNIGLTDKYINQLVELINIWMDDKLERKN